MLHVSQVPVPQVPVAQVPVPQVPQLPMVVRLLNLPLWALHQILCLFLVLHEHPHRLDPWRPFLHSHHPAPVYLQSHSQQYVPPPPANRLCPEHPQLMISLHSQRRWVLGHLHLLSLQQPHPLSQVSQVPVLHVSQVPLPHVAVPQVPDLQVPVPQVPQLPVVVRLVELRLCDCRSSGAGQHERSDEEAAVIRWLSNFAATVQWR